jgi:uncharacterized protein (DUF1015 family)
MIDLRPFRALHYNQAAVGNLADVVAPPYDVIDAVQLDQLYARSPLNVVRLILNRSEDRYSVAAAELSAWRQNGIIVQDDTPCLHYYVQDFTLSDGRSRTRRGVIGVVRLEPFEAGNIRPHEKTFSAAKQDRMRLIEACRTNLSPIFSLYPERCEAVAGIEERFGEQSPWIDLTDDTGQRNRVWRLADEQSIEAIVSGLKETTLFIADGHHRYETALAYRNRLAAAGRSAPGAPHNFILMYLASMDDPGLVILPTHRVLRRTGALTGKDWWKRLEPHFEMEVIRERPELSSRLSDSRPGEAIGLYHHGSAQPLLLRLRSSRFVDELLRDMHPAVRRLDVTLLDAFVLRRLLDVDCSTAAQEGQLLYTHEDASAFAAVDHEGAAAAFFVRAPTVREVQAVCLSGHTMPEKSTYFYPKLLSGLVFHSLEPTGTSA